MKLQQFVDYKREELYGEVVEQAIWLSTSYGKHQNYDKAKAEIALSYYCTEILRNDGFKREYFDDDTLKSFINEHFVDYSDYISIEELESSIFKIENYLKNIVKGSEYNRCHICNKLWDYLIDTAYDKNQYDFFIPLFPKIEQIEDIEKLELIDFFHKENTLFKETLYRSIEDRALYIYHFASTHNEEVSMSKILYYNYNIDNVLDFKIVYNRFLDDSINVNADKFEID